MLMIKISLQTKYINDKGGNMNVEKVLDIYNNFELEAFRDINIKEKIDYFTNSIIVYSKNKKLLKA